MRLFQVVVCEAWAWSDNVSAACHLSATLGATPAASGEMPHAPVIPSPFVVQRANSTHTWWQQTSCPSPFCHPFLVVHTHPQHVAWHEQPN